MTKLFKKKKRKKGEETWSFGWRKTEEKINQSPVMEMTVKSEKSESVSLSVMLFSLWPMDCSPPGSSVHHGILQARILEWVAIPFSRGSSWLNPGLLHCRKILYCLSQTVTVSKSTLLTPGSPVEQGSQPSCPPGLKNCSWHAVPTVCPNWVDQQRCHCGGWGGESGMKVEESRRRAWSPSWIFTSLMMKHLLSKAENCFKLCILS